MNNRRNNEIVLGLHLGRDGFNHREKRDHFVEEDMYWNIKYIPNFRKVRASLVYSDYVFRIMYNEMISSIAYRDPFQ